MSEAKHTPGPWEVAQYSDGAYIMSDHVDPGFGVKQEVARVHAKRHDDARGHANARLIAAAPELLEALRKIDDEDGRHFHIDANCKCLLRAAIAKAEGRQA